MSVGVIITPNIQRLQRVCSIQQCSGGPAVQVLGRWLYSAGVCHWSESFIWNICDAINVLKIHQQGMTWGFVFISALKSSYRSYLPVMSRYSPRSNCLGPTRQADRQVGQEGLIPPLVVTHQMPAQVQVWFKRQCGALFPCRGAKKVFQTKYHR